LKYKEDILSEVLTWCYSEAEDVEYGLLYNWFAATDGRGIASEGWHVPTSTEVQSLIDYLDPLTEGIAGGKLKEIGLTYWKDPNTGATNEVGFNARGSAFRGYDTGLFYDLTEALYIWCSDGWDEDESFAATLAGYDHADAWIVAGYFNYGYTIRLIKDSTSLTHGETGTYTGNDGKVYPTICVGTQEWLACNIAETKYRNGDAISEVTDTAEWVALTTGALCAYDNDWENV
jgi:uncharacterized protein (TIGR02145 family)